MAAEGNRSLKLDTEAAQLQSLSPRALRKDVQVENLRTSDSRLVCALKSQAHEHEGVSSAVSRAWKSPEPDAPDPKRGLETRAP